MTWNFSSCSGSMVSMDGGSKKKRGWGRLNSEKKIISQKNHLCSHEHHILSQLPPSKFLLVPGIGNQLIRIFPDSDWIQAEFWSLKDVHYWTTMIHWGRLCWKKKIITPTFTCLFFSDKNLHALHFLRKWFLQWFLYIKINNFPLI